MEGLSGAAGRQIKYTYNYAPTLAKFALSNAFMRGLMGPFRSGKSSACVIEMIRRAMEQKPGADGIRRTRWMVVRNTTNELRDTSIRTVLMWLPEATFGVFNKTNLNYTITAIPGCHIEIWFRALDKPEHVKHLLSLEITGAWLNEAREIPWSIVEGIQGRVNQYPSKAMGGCTWGGLWLDTNPPDTTTAWYKFWEEKTHNPAFAQIFKQPSGLAPNAENLPFINGGRSYYERLTEGKDDEWINVYIHGQYGFTRAGKPVYPDFSDALHVQDVPPIPGLPVHRGFDWGLTPACIFSQMTPENRWNVFDELVSEDMSVEAFLEVVADHSMKSFRKKPDFIDTGDPAGAIRSQVDARSIFQAAQARGFNIQPGIQAPAIRLEAIRRPLRRIINGKPQFILNPRCTTLRKGFLGGYHYRRMSVSGERYTEEPYKNEFSHPHDALQYTGARIFAPLILQGLEQERAHVEDMEVWDPNRAETGY